MKIIKTEHGNMCEVRLKNRRIRVYRLHDKSWAVSFVRPTKACAGCEDDSTLEHKLYIGKRGRTVMTGLRLSREAMTAFCNAVEAEGKVSLCCGGEAATFIGLERNLKNDNR